MMKRRVLHALAAALVLVCARSSVAATVPGDEPPKVKIPEPGVPQIMTLEGAFIRAAYNNEGYVILGYRSPTCRSASLGCCSRWASPPRGRQGLRAEARALTLETPDGKTHPLPIEQGVPEADLRALCSGRRSSATRSTTSRRTRSGLPRRLLRRAGQPRLAGTTSS